MIRRTSGVLEEAALLDGDEVNEKADKLAVQASQEFELVPLK